jgi:hypothetical protein
VDELIGAGFAPDSISVVATDATRRRYFPMAIDRPRTGKGAATGGALGAITGGILAVASLGIPGGVVVAGPLAAALGGLATGGLAGALMGAGLTEDEAKIYEAEIKDGAVLVGVEAADPALVTMAESILATYADTLPNRTIRGGDLYLAP